MGHGSNLYCPICWSRFNVEDRKECILPGWAFSERKYINIYFFQDDRRSSEGGCVFGSSFKTPHHFRSYSEISSPPSFNSSDYMCDGTHPWAYWMTSRCFLISFPLAVNLFCFWSLRENVVTCLQSQCCSAWIKTKFGSSPFFFIFHISSENRRQIKNLGDPASAVSWLDFTFLYLCLWLDAAYRKKGLLYSTACFSLRFPCDSIPLHISAVHCNLAARNSTRSTVAERRGKKRENI